MVSQDLLLMVSNKEGPRGSEIFTKNVLQVVPSKANLSTTNCIFQPRQKDVAWEGVTGIENRMGFIYRKKVDIATYNSKLPYKQY